MNRRRRTNPMWPAPIARFSGYSRSDRATVADTLNPMQILAKSYRGEALG